MKKVTKEIRCVYEAGLENMVVLVSTRLDGKNYVMTSGTVAEVSHKPPMLCVSICPERHTHDVILKRGAFVINLLSVKQKPLARACGSCSGRKVDKFEKYKIPYTISKGDLPFIQGCLANIGCRLVGSHLYGDHTICVGEMFEAEVYGVRTSRHLLLSDMTGKIPKSAYLLAKRIPFLHNIKNLFGK